MDIPTLSDLKRTDWLINQARASGEISMTASTAMRASPAPLVPINYARVSMQCCAAERIPLGNGVTC